LLLALLSLWKDTAIDCREGGKTVIFIPMIFSDR
jgi:hypothetical protein